MILHTHLFLSSEKNNVKKNKPVIQIEQVQTCLMFFHTRSKLMNITWQRWVHPLDNPHWRVFLACSNCVIGQTWAKAASFYDTIHNDTELMTNSCWIEVMLSQLLGDTGEVSKSIKVHYKNIKRVYDWESTSVNDCLTYVIEKTEISRCFALCAMSRGVAFRKITSISIDSLWMNDSFHLRMPRLMNRGTSVSEDIPRHQMTHWDCGTPSEQLMTVNLWHSG